MATRFQRATIALALLASWTAAAAAQVATEKAADAVAVASSRPALSQARVVSFGLFGPESVFESEARRAAVVLGQWLGASTPPVVRFNTKRRANVSPGTIAATLGGAGAAMDPTNGLLAVILTSHGSPDGLAIVAGRRQRTLSPRDLRAMLDASGARYRVVIISACYSGVFVPALADPRTLVITAAAADRPSFGCEDGATWTYFGDAFFNQALRTASTLEAAFETARQIVTARERLEGYQPSNPQMAGGSEVLALLARR
jgi:hypothetical protein